MAHVEVKVKQVKAPCSGKIRGYRIVAAVWNREQCSTDFGRGEPEWVQSFAPKYLVAEYGDYTTDAQAARALPSVLESLASRGFIVDRVHG